MHPRAGLTCHFRRRRTYCAVAATSTCMHAPPRAAPVTPACLAASPGCVPAASASSHPASLLAAAAQGRLPHPTAFTPPPPDKCRRQQMRLDTASHPVMLAEPSFNSREAREKAVELLFENYDCPGAGWGGATPGGVAGSSCRRGEWRGGGGGGVRSPSKGFWLVRLAAREWWRSTVLQLCSCPRFAATYLRLLALPPTCCHGPARLSRLQLSSWPRTLC